MLEINLNHLNIKPNNILLEDTKKNKSKSKDEGEEEEKKPEVVEFRFSDFLSTRKEKFIPALRKQEDYDYMSPELKQQHMTNTFTNELDFEKCDVFSLGMIVLRCALLIPNDEFDYLQDVEN